MSTNFYVYTGQPTCEHCGRPDPDANEFHLGKRSAGWRFLYHAESGWPIEDAYRLWLDTLRRGEIRDEYGRVYTTEEMLEVIADLAGNEPHDVHERDRMSRDSAGRDWSFRYFC